MLSLLIPTRKAILPGSSLFYPRFAPPAAVQTKAGPVISPENLYTLSLVWCATSAISEATALCPLNLYRKNGDDGRVEAVDHPAYRLLKQAPNLQMDAAIFRESRTAHQVNYGGGFAEIQYDGRGNPVGLHPIHPGRVSSPSMGDRLPGGETVPENWYRVRNKDRSFTFLPPERMLHVPGRHSDDGIWARGVFAFAQEEMGLAKATLEHAADYFGGGAQPRGLLTIPSLRPGDKETPKRIRQDWEDQNQAGKRRVAVLGTEASYTAVGANLDDAEWVQADQANVNRVSRWYRIPPHMLYDLTKSSYSSAELLGIEFLVFSLSPLHQKWTGQAWLKLLSPAQRQDHYFEHNVAALLRGDLKTRMEAYQKGLMQGILTVNEVRGMENLPRVGPEGDKLYMPANMTALDKLAEAPARSGFSGLGSDQSGQQPADPERAFHEFTSKNPEIRQEMAKIAADSHGNYGKMDVISAAKAVFFDAIQRLSQVEATAATRTVDSKADFDRWAGEFYPKHQARLTAALAPCQGLVRLAGRKQEMEAISHAVCDYNRREMARAYNETTKSAFHERMGRWAIETAERFTETIFGEQP